MKEFFAKPAAGHAAALFTAIVWGTTMIASKILLTALTPSELMFGRFLLAFLVLEALPFPHRGFFGWKNELRFFLMGLCGVALYFFFENTALSYTYASNVSIIVTTSPLFTALLTRVIHRGTRLGLRFFAGFVIAIIGIAVLCYNGAAVLKLNPLGDLLTLAAAIVWSIYSILINGMTQNLHPTQITRRIFFYGLVCMLPMLPFTDFSLLNYQGLLDLQMLGSLLYLALIASALCYITWNYAIRTLTAVKTSAYIYCVPVVTVIASALFLQERVTWLTVLGIVLTLAGLIFSIRSKRKATRPPSKAYPPEPQP